MPLYNNPTELWQVRANETGMDSSNPSTWNTQLDQSSPWANDYGINAMRQGAQKYNENVYDQANGGGPALNLVRGADGNWTNTNADANQLYVQNKLNALNPSPTQQPAAQQAPNTPASFWSSASQQTTPTANTSPTAQGDFWAQANAPLPQASDNTMQPSDFSYSGQGGWTPQSTPETKAAAMGLQQDASGNWYNPAAQSTSQQPSGVEQWLTQNPDTGASTTTQPPSSQVTANENTLFSMGVDPALLDKLDPNWRNSSNQDVSALASYLNDQSAVSQYQYAAGNANNPDSWSAESAAANLANRTGLSNDVSNLFSGSKYGGSQYADAIKALTANQTFNPNDYANASDVGTTDYYDDYITKYNEALKSGDSAALSEANNLGVKGMYQYLNGSNTYNEDQLADMLRGLYSSDALYAQAKSHNTGAAGFNNDLLSTNNADMSALWDKAFGNTGFYDAYKKAGTYSRDNPTTYAQQQDAKEAALHSMAAYLADPANKANFDTGSLTTLFQNAGLGNSFNTSLDTYTDKLAADKAAADLAAKQTLNTNNLLNSYAKKSGITSPLNAMSFG